MAPIGLIAAMTQESNALLHCVNGGKRIALGKFSGKCLELSGQTCIMVTSGMGTWRASEATRELVKINAPSLLISFGIAGAVDVDLEIGDVVLVEGVCRLDQGVASQPLPIDHWSDAAKEAAARVLTGRGAHLFTGTAVTTGGSQILGNSFTYLVHPILEMETAGIAQVAAEKGIPLLSLRAISDGPCAPIPINLDKMMDEKANLRIGMILLEMVRHPRIALQFGGLIRNSRIAAENAAIALTAALSSTHF
jgi:adenosylhomocysteine nucleosidase